MNPRRDRARSLRAAGLSYGKIGAELGIWPGAAWRLVNRSSAPPRDHRGAKNANSRLSEGDVREIKTRLARGVVGAVLAREYEVDPGLISMIKHGKRWSHVEAA